MPSSQKCPQQSSAGKNMENIDHKIIKWVILHYVWLQNNRVDFVLDTWQWDSCRSKATLCIHNTVLNTQWQNTSFQQCQSMAESEHEYFACHVEVNDHAPNWRSQKSKARWDRAPHATYTYMEHQGAQSHRRVRNWMSYWAKPSKKAGKDSEIKTELYALINALSKEWRKTSIRVHSSTAPEAECSVVRQCHLNCGEQTKNESQQPKRRKSFPHCVMLAQN
jgi:hypothetical protein